MAEYSLAEVKDRDDAYLVEGGGYTQDKVTSALSQFMTIGGFGDTTNEVSTTYLYANGAHHIKLLDRVSPEVMLVFMSQMVGFHLKVKSGGTVKVTERSLKKSMLLTADLI